MMVVLDFSPPLDLAFCLLPSLLSPARQREACGLWLLISCWSGIRHALEGAGHALRVTVVEPT